MSKIKKIIITFALIASIIAPSVVLSNEVTVQAATIKLNKKSITLEVGKIEKLAVTGTKATTTWKSSNSKIASVSAKGIVKGIKAGSATITATVNKTKLTCSVTVKAKKAAVKDKTMELQGYTLTYPDNYVITTKDIAADGAVTHYVYLSSKSNPDKYLARVSMKKAAFEWDGVKAFLKPKMNDQLIIPTLIQTYNLSDITVSDIKMSDYDADFLKGILKVDYKYEAAGNASGKGIIYLGMIGDQLYQADVIDAGNADIFTVVEKWYNSAKK